MFRHVPPHTITHTIRVESMADLAIRWLTCSFGLQMKTMFAFARLHWPSFGHVQAVSNVWALSETFASEVIQDFKYFAMICDDTISGVTPTISYLLF